MAKHELSTGTTVMLVAVFLAARPAPGAQPKPLPTGCQFLSSDYVIIGASHSDSEAQRLAERILRAERSCYSQRDCLIIEFSRDHQAEFDACVLPWQCAAVIPQPNRAIMLPRTLAIEAIDSGLRILAADVETLTHLAIYDEAMAYYQRHSVLTQDAVDLRSREMAELTLEECETGVLIAGWAHAHMEGRLTIPQILRENGKSVTVLQATDDAPWSEWLGPGDNDFVDLPTRWDRNSRHWP
jgi:hypothetical protein